MKHWQKSIFYLLPFACSLFLCSLPTYAQKSIETTCNQQYVNSKCVKQWQQIIPELAKAEIIYLGEIHDNFEDHQKQKQIIQQLHQRRPKIAIAMEMFQLQYQEIINQYLAGKLTEAELLKKSEYEKRWGFTWEYYAEILRFAKKNKLPVLALNTPSEITRKVAMEGWEKLTAAEKKLIPPLAEINLDNREYRQLVLAAFQKHQAGGHGNSDSADRFFLAQVLWDETMASGIAKFVLDNPDFQVVVLAGQGHIAYNYGIPSRVERRLKEKQNFTQRSVLLSPPIDAVPKNKQIADFILEKP